MSKKKDDRQLLAKNRRALHEYHVLETVEAGVMLLGTEVKSVRAGKVQLREAFVEFRGGEAFLVAAHISPYTHGNRENHDPLRERKLLLAKREIENWYGRVQNKGITVVPLSLYLKGNRIKVELALVQGKTLYDKRLDEKKKELDREVEETLSRRAWRDTNE